MRRLKRAAILAVSAALAIGILSGCGASHQQSSGLNLSVCLGGGLTTLDPIRATTEEDQTVIEHLYENLMRASADNDGGTTVANGIAKSYNTDKNYDGTVTYTFKLRSAKWSDGTAVTPADFVYAWQRLADPVSASPNAQILSIVAGFDEVQSTGDVTKLQVEAKNDSTFCVTLTGDCPWFLTDVCTAAATMPLRKDVVQTLKADAIKSNKAASEAGQEATATWSSDPMRLVTNGQYCTSSYQVGNRLVLATNGKYTGTASGPDTVTFRFAETAEEAWQLYDAKEVDFISPLPEEQISKLAEDEDWTPTTELNTGVLLFNTATDPFSDPQIRNALSLAVDRTALSGELNAAARPATGLVPYGVPAAEDEDFRTAGGELIDCNPENYAASCDAARSLLEQSSYDRGEFSAVELLYPAGNADAESAAKAVVAAWNTQLNISVQTREVEQQELDDALSAGTYTLALVELKGYANDEESFLSQWESGSTQNAVRYYNSAYDTLLTVIDSASDSTARLGCLHDAESLLLSDCPLMPLYFPGTAWKLREGLTGVCRDGRGWFSFETVAKTTEG